MTRPIFQISDRERFAKAARRYSPVRVMRSLASTFVMEGNHMVERSALKIHYVIDLLATDGSEMTWTYTEVIPADSSGEFDLERSLLKTFQNDNITTRIMREYSASL
jgi:hypothetical protein